MFVDRKFSILLVVSLFQGVALSYTFFLLQAFSIERLGFGPLEVGLTIALTGLANALTQPIWGRLVERCNNRLLGALGIFSGGMFTYLVYSSQEPLQFYSFVALSSSMFGLANTAWLDVIGEITTLTNRGKVSGLLNTTSNVGRAIFSPIAGYLMDVAGYETSALVGFGAAIIASSFLTVFPKNYRVQLVSGEHEEAPQPSKAYRSFLIASVIWSFIWSMAWPLFSVAQVKLFNLSKSQIGTIGMVANLVQIVLQPVWGAASDKYGRKPFLIITPALTSAVPFSYYFGKSFEHVLIGTGVGMVGFSMYFTISPAYLLDASTEGRGRKISTFNALTSLTNAVAPLIGGTLGELVGVRTMMLVMGIIRLASVTIFTKIPETVKVEGGRAHGP